MEKATETATKIIDMLPAMGASKCDLIHGWAIKIALAAAVVEILMSLGSWKNFGWTLVFELILSIVGLYLNRHCKDTGVWIVALLSVLVYPVMHMQWVENKFHF